MKHSVLTDERFGYYRRNIRLLLTKRSVITNEHSVITDKSEQPINNTYEMDACTKNMHGVNGSRKKGKT
jgi:hypothetical protein